MTAPTLEAERAAFEATRKPRTDLNRKGDRYTNPVVQNCWETWQAARTATPAPADVALPLDAEGLPPLTRWTFDGGMTASAAADGQWVQFKNVAPYAERIRLLERKLATFKAEHATQHATLQPAQSIASDEYFWELINAWIEHNFSGSRKWAIIAHIDGRTAGAAFPEQRNIFEFKRLGEFTVQVTFKSARACGKFVERIAAAPSPLPPREDAQ